MRALFCHDTYYVRDGNGQVRAAGAFPYALWQNRFLPYFNELVVIGRERPLAPGDETGLDISGGPGVNQVLFPNINTSFRRLFKSREIFRQIGKQVGIADAVIIRGPSEFGMMAARAARKLGKPCAVEMSGCAFDHVWHHGRLSGKLYAPVKFLRARHMVRNADAVIYVTESFLQKRYPVKGFTAQVSNVDLEKPDPSVLERRLQKIKNPGETLIFGLIGNFTNNLKGLDVALRALARTRGHLPDFELRLLGPGEPGKWTAHIRRAGLEGRVVFSGIVQGGLPVLDWLDGIDIYLQPSRHEGLPRALIEAMSRGCPCLASDAGGTGELLDPDFIHARGNADQLAAQILDLAGNKNLQTAQAGKNFLRAQDFSREILEERRRGFWSRFATLAGQSQGAAHL